MQAASQSETWEWNGKTWMFLSKKRVGICHFLCGSVESSHWEAISATLKQLDAVYLEMIYSDTKDKFQLSLPEEAFCRS